MKIVWAVGSRSGGTFLCHLTRSILGSRINPTVEITSGRSEGDKLGKYTPHFYEFYKNHRSLEFFEHYNIQSAKIEDPGIDCLCRQISASYPNALFLTSIRNIEDVIISHFNIKKWGRDEDFIINSYINAIDFFEKLFHEKRLYMIKIDDRSRFNLDDFCKFLGASFTPEALDIASNWKVINPLSRMKKKANEKFDHKEIPENIDLLYQRYPLLHEVNLRYEKILNNIQV